MYTNSRMIAVIDEHIHSSWQRQALKLRFCDGMTHEQIAEALNEQTRRELERIIQKMER